MEQDRFDMFARPETVDPEIDTITMKLAIAQVPDLDPVTESAVRPDLEVREDWMLRLEVPDLEAPGLGTPSAPVDFIRVRGSPIVRGRRGDG
jgi:hypothetical protein